jgi:hypothetical protein
MRARFEGRSRPRAIHRARGWVDYDGEITPAGEREAEERHNPYPEPDDFDLDAPHGWAPDPFPGGMLQ